MLRMRLCGGVGRYLVTGRRHRRPLAAGLSLRAAAGLLLRSMDWEDDR